MRHRVDVLVVGAGPAGIAAAVRAAEEGRRVGLVDGNALAGGQIWRGSLWGRGSGEVCGGW
ncbi:MAG: FAD-dependent oxidoreductase [Edaphobacter sp.]